MSFLSAINDEPVFTALGLTDETVIVGQSSTIESIYLIQIISFAESYHSIDSAKHDISEYLSIPNKDVTFADFAAYLSDL